MYNSKNLFLKDYDGGRNTYFFGAVGATYESIVKNFTIDENYFITDVIYNGNTEEITLAIVISNGIGYTTTPYENKALREAIVAKLADYI